MRKLNVSSGALLLTSALILGCSRQQPEALPEPTRTATWSPAQAINAAGESIASSMAAVSARGEKAIAWVQTDGDATQLFVTTDKTTRSKLSDAEGQPGSDPESPPKLAFGAKDEVFVVYQLSKTTEPGMGNSSLRFSRTTDGGAHWSSPVTVVDDGLWGLYRSDHAFHRAGDGTLYVAWLDSRDGHVRLRANRSVDGGATWSRSVLVDAESPCECCRVALASADGGRVYLVWRKIAADGARDMAIARSTDRGLTWSAPAPVHADGWKVDGCPDAGPSLLADADGSLHLGWWTGKTGAAGVKVASSTDGGAHWQDPIPLKIATDSQASHVQLSRAGPALYAAWEDGTLKAPQILLAISHDNGRTFAPAQAMSAEGEPASHPVIASGAMRTLLVWNQHSATSEQSSVLARELRQE